MDKSKNNTDTLILASGEGLTYNCGAMNSIFKADDNETSKKYSISKWRPEPNSEGP
ncbi:hypothetical protein [Chryseobacterium sp. CBo1]|uniref:hypothetical protein n=1 Tax=Chryseobacterium sp. CBo1 TaxID=1869230 RepID=UPI0013F4CBC1|nr:hypothetical protein [Chryseobacterium sp. CBo1]